MICAIAELKCHRPSKSCVTLRSVWCAFRSSAFSFSDAAAGAPPLVFRGGSSLLVGGPGSFFEQGSGLFSPPPATSPAEPACLSTTRYTRFKNLHDPSILSSLHSKSFSGGAANSVYSLPVSAPYFCAISSAPTTFPRDFDIATPPFCTIPCVNSRAIGSLCFTNPKSRITLHQNLEYSRCRIAWVIPPMYWSIVNQYATFAGSKGILSLCGSQYR